MKKKMKKIDKYITWLILGGAVASIFGVATKVKTKKINDKKLKKQGFFNKIFWLLGGVVLKVTKLFSRKK